MNAEQKALEAKLTAMMDQQMAEQKPCADTPCVYLVMKQMG